MEELISAFMIGTIAVAVVLGFALLTGYPTMVMINYVLSPTLITLFFGASKITFWKAVVLNILMGWFFGHGGTKGKS